jgi:hypothetical protein
MDQNKTAMVEIKISVSTYHSSKSGFPMENFDEL